MSLRKGGDDHDRARRDSLGDGGVFEDHLQEQVILRYGFALQTLVPTRCRERA